VLVFEDGPMPGLVSEMMDMMSYVLSQDLEFVKVDGQDFEYTGMYVVQD
jgi:hypothetical protein